MTEVTFNSYFLVVLLFGLRFRRTRVHESKLNTIMWCSDFDLRLKLDENENCCRDDCTTTVKNFSGKWLNYRLKVNSLQTKIQMSHEFRVNWNCHYHWNLAYSDARKPWKITWIKNNGRNTQCPVRLTRLFCQNPVSRNDYLPSKVSGLTWQEIGLRFNLERKAEQTTSPRMVMNSFWLFGFSLTRVRHFFQPGWPAVI